MAKRDCRFAMNFKYSADARYWLPATRYFNQLADQIRPVFRVEPFALRFVCALIGVSSEEVTLSLQQVSREAFSTVGIVVA